MTLLGSDEGEPLTQIKAHLVTKHAGGASAGAITLEHTVVADMPHQIEILFHI
jgi:hypothetical protein